MGTVFFFPTKQSILSQDSTSHQDATDQAGLCRPLRRACNSRLEIYQNNSKIFLKCYSTRSAVKRRREESERRLASDNGDLRDRYVLQFKTSIIQSVTISLLAVLIKYTNTTVFSKFWKFRTRYLIQVLVKGATAMAARVRKERFFERKANDLPERNESGAEMEF